jgi:hypothetical protein
MRLHGKAAYIALLPYIDVPSLYSDQIDPHLGTLSVGRTTPSLYSRAKEKRENIS